MTGDAPNPGMQSETEEQTDSQEQPDAVVEDAEIPAEELKQGYMRQADYTRKTQELADLRKRLSMWEELDQYMADNPHKREQLMAVFSDDVVTEPEPDDSTEEESDTMSDEREQLRKELEALRGDVKDMRSTVRSTELEKQLEKALADFPKADRDSVLGKAYLPSNREKSFADLAREEQEAKEASVSELREKLLEELNAERQTLGLGQGSVPGKVVKPKDEFRADSKQGVRKLLDEADADTIRMLLNRDKD